MEASELRELGRRAREQIERALAREDWEEALHQCAPLAKEYILIHKGLRRVLQFALEYIEQVFREEQAKIAEEIASAIQARNVAEAHRLLAERDRQHRVIHDLFITMKASFYSYMGEVFGDQRLQGILRYTGERQKRGFVKWEEMPVEDFVRATVHLLKTHMGQVEVREDEDKFTVIQNPCGSGGRLMREGRYTPGGRLYRIDNAQPMTFGKTDFPSYCAHCAVWNNMQTTEWFGHPQWVIDHPESPDAPCCIHIYKDPRKIPEHYFSRIGKRKE